MDIQPTTSPPIPRRVRLSQIAMTSMPPSRRARSCEGCQVITWGTMRVSWAPLIPRILGLPRRMLAILVGMYQQRANLATTSSTPGAMNMQTLDMRTSLRLPLHNCRAPGLPRNQATNTSIPRLFLLPHRPPSLPTIPSNMPCPLHRRSSR